MVWDLAEAEAARLESFLNRKRSLYALKKLKEFTDGHPTPALYMEFISVMSKEKIMSPHIILRMGRYIRQNRTITSAFGLPPFIGGYIIFDKYIDRSKAWKALESVEHKSVQAFFALMISGFRYYKTARKLRVCDYDKNTGIVDEDAKVVPAAKRYLDEQYDRALADGLSPEDPLFYVKRPDTKARMLEMREIEMINKRAYVRTGVDLFAYGLLVYRMQFTEVGKPVRVFKERKGDKGRGYIKQHKPLWSTARNAKITVPPVHTLATNDASSV